MLGYKTKHASRHRSSGLQQLKNSLPSLDHHTGTPPDTGSSRAPRKKAPVERYIPREDSLELRDLFSVDRSEKKLQADESNRTEGTESDSWNESAGSFSSSSLASHGGRWMASNESIENVLSLSADESVLSKTSSRSGSNGSSSDATTRASNLSAILRARCEVISQSSTTVDAEYSNITSRVPISATGEIDELDLMEYTGEYTGSGSCTASSAKSPLGTTLAMMTKMDEADARLTKDINAFENTVQAAGDNKRLDGCLSRCLSDTNLVLQYQMKQQEIEQLQRIAADRKGEDVRYKQMADQLNNTSSSSLPVTRSPTVELGEDEEGKRCSQLTRSGRGTKDLPSAVISQTPGGSILKQEHQRRYSSVVSSDLGGNMGMESFHESINSFQSQDSFSARFTSSFSVKFKKPTVIRYEKEQDYRTPYDSDGRRRRPSRHHAAEGADLNYVVQNEVVARRLATTGRRTTTTHRRDSMPAGHMGESSPAILPRSMPKASRHSMVDMITSMEQRLRRQSNESNNDDSSSQGRPNPGAAKPVRRHSDQSSPSSSQGRPNLGAAKPARRHSEQSSPLPFDYSSNISRRLSGDAVSSFYRCPEDNMLDLTLQGVGERGATTTFSSADESRAGPRSSPRTSPRVVTRPSSKMERLAKKAFGVGGKRR